MNPIKAIYCRTVQAVLRAALPVLPYREPEIFRSCDELNAVFFCGGAGGGGIWPGFGINSVGKPRLLPHSRRLTLSQKSVLQTNRRSWSRPWAASPTPAGSAE